MYLTLTETAEFLDLPEEYVLKMIRVHKIRAVYDGEQYLVNKNQFSTHVEQMEKYREMIQDYLNEPIPEDPDVKDED
ncbi:DNA binding domain-containing protein, excisionase family [Halobacillus alkaliphilus]|uniref:DNA binding domain-containing protein, excisionase family n=1 Tax=Halobacillus alkaliphilus TaxID=396056 RepID=A0A1I2QEN8_9BACI|nr:excisionase family DNA-binding protein [Halobacillus alkaliphilus]SFG24717.1 DNA binding domain-containing protein, excisionase family [Halobacillus alkaliphilus]